MRRFSFKRPLTDYTKVQDLIGRFVRGKTFFISRKKRGIEYLDIGCGPNINDEFINLDYNWSTRIDVCWDLTSGRLPFSDNSFRGVFTEHCFEHIPLASFKANMKEIYRILKPGGILRLIMPDGEMYLDIYQRRKQGESLPMPYEEGYISPMHRINGIFRNHGHQFIYDFYTVEVILRDAGFASIVKQSYKTGSDPRLLRDTEYRAIESLYVEALK